MENTFVAAQLHTPRRRPRVLAVDDNGTTLRDVKKMLESEYDVLLASSGRRAIELAGEQGRTPDLVLLDVMMPGMDGFQTFTALRQHEKTLGYPHAPVIFLTGEEGSDTEREGLKLGASDFVRKPISKDILLRRIRNAIDNNRTIGELLEEATVDKLTGFLNKSAGTQRVSMFCREAAGALAIMDLDSFKLVNDLYGHDAGDKVLKAFADAIRKNIRESDVVVRIGGDEFMAFFDGIDGEADIAALSKRLNKQFVEDSAGLLGSNEIPLGVSIGAALIPSHSRDYTTLFGFADQALYSVKQNGKHGYALYHQPERGESGSLSLEAEINRITQAISERNDNSGALILGREAFYTVSRFIMRFYKRYGGNGARILFSLNSKGASADVYAEAASQFGIVLQKTLRNSDLVMQVRQGQYFVLLTERSEFEAGRVIERVSERWNRTTYSKQIKADVVYKTDKLEAERHTAVIS